MVDVADADERRVDAVTAERGLAVVAVGVGGLIVGGGHAQPRRRSAGWQNVTSSRVMNAGSA